MCDLALRLEKVAKIATVDCIHCGNSGLYHRNSILVVLQMFVPNTVSRKLCSATYCFG